MIEFDKIDVKLLASLQRDASPSIETLAEQVNLSRNACWRRIKLLEERGAVCRRVALLNPRAMGCALTVLMYVKAARHDKQWLQQFKQAVKRIPELVSVYRTSGEIDYVLKARVADVASYDALYQELIAAVPLGDMSASFVMEEIKDTTELPLP